MEPDLICVVDAHYTYDVDSDRPIPALRGVSLQVRRGERLAIIGRNGSGKSTLAKCLNGLLLPTQGDALVKGMSTRDAEAAQRIRATVGLVLQNPDNQFVATTVEEEAAFGPENLGIPRAELRARVDAALRQTGLWQQRDRNLQHLSAGEKARLAVAGMLAMQPECLVLDESTAMLDPGARRELLDVVRALHAKGLTVVSITHFMAEAAEAERVIALDGGRIALEGTPREVFAQEAVLDRLGLGLPAAAGIARGLRRRGWTGPESILHTDELVLALAPAEARPT
ncbi:MAG: energy-coupling factor transporter ATPase [Chloroflexi bacterium]|nr:energy-coupling factor transporter ATPase [Chloroflexota bacterium]